VSKKQNSSINAAGLPVIHSKVNGTDPNPGFVLIEAPSIPLTNVNAEYFHDGLEPAQAGQIPQSGNSLPRPRYI
jgi:hypothetical protein